MDRKDFFKLMGGSAATVLMFNCLGCSKGSSDPGTNSAVTGPTGIDFTLDLSATANASLATNGGYLVSQGVLVARTSAGAYIAVQQSCTHESYALVYQGGSARFYCNNHGSAFTEKGVVVNAPANRNLTVYNTTLTGTSLRVYS